MGYYTEVTTNLTLRTDLSPETRTEVENILRFMVGATNDELYQDGSRIPAEAVQRPKHPLFETERWQLMLCCSYASLIADYGSKETSEGLRFRSHSSFKHYENEIEKFVDWIRPYLAPQKSPFFVSVTEDDFEKKFYVDGRVLERQADRGYY